MEFDRQLIFLFSALGAANGFLLSVYFFWKKAPQNASMYFLAGLFLMLSIRVIKSAFLHFNRQLFEVFIEVGLGACFLIGPFLYLYMKHAMSGRSINKAWFWHIVPYVLAIFLFSMFYPYHDNRVLWRWAIKLIYKQWMLYLLAAGYLMWPILKKLALRKNKLTTQEYWLLNIFIGNAVVWIAYETSSYTSYIVGALSFTFILYISIVVWVLRRQDWNQQAPTTEKYANSSLDKADVVAYIQRLDDYMREQKPYLDPNLTLTSLSTQLEVSSKALSQAINQSKGQNYSIYIAGLRVAEAQRLLALPSYQHYKVAAIAFESGFNSLSSFNTYFKKITGQTAQAYRKTLGK